MGTPTNRAASEDGCSCIQMMNCQPKDSVENSLQSRDWQEPELLEDIKAATGVDLNVTKRGKGRGKSSKKPKHEGLTNITELQNTPRTRLEKKLFNRSSMKRVAEKMNNIESKKFKDKFADQFNYMYNT